jgi:hypothetical protein
MILVLNPVKAVLWQGFFFLNGVVITILFDQFIFLGQPDRV